MGNNLSFVIRPYLGKRSACFPNIAKAILIQSTQGHLKFINKEYGNKGPPILFSFLKLLVGYKYGTLMPKNTIRYYETEVGATPFLDWFERLDRNIAPRISVAIERMEEGNFGDVKSLGKGVWERKIPFGPGYRVYFGKDSNTVVILLTGGTKRRQSRDVNRAQQFWADYITRKETRDGSHT